MTHPIQYYAPWFRYIAQHLADVSLKVHYCVIPTPEQQGVGFDESFEWDASLLEGYEYVILRKPSHKVTIHSSSFMGVTVPEVASSVRNAKPDVVMVPGWYSVSLVLAAMSSRRRGIPVLYRGDSQLSMSGAFASIPKRLRTRAMLDLFTHYLSVGKRNHQFLRNYSVPESRIFFAPHCVDNEFFSRSAATVDRVRERKALGIGNDDFVVLYAGKLEEKKRPWEVIEAAAAMAQPPVVIVAGSGEMEPRCRTTARASRGKVIFAGFRNQTEIARLYGLADCLVLPSDEGETWGLVVNEALAAGVPCIVSDRVGCGPDLIENGVTGFVTPYRDTHAIATKLGELRDMRNGGRDLSAACRKRSERYSFATATAGLQDAINATTRDAR